MSALGALPLFPRLTLPLLTVASAGHLSWIGGEVFFFVVVATGDPGSSSGSGLEL